MPGLQTTNLGNQAQTQRLLTQNVSALNYQQPFLQLGTLAVPLIPAALTTIPYVAGFQKYVCYILTAASTVPILQQFEITGAPVNLVGGYTISSSVDWVLTAPLLPTALTVYPVFSQVIGIFNDTLAGIPTSRIRLLAESATPATFASGTAIMKMIININLD